MEQVIIHNRRGPAGAGYLELKVRAAKGLTAERQQELEALLSELAEVECKITPVGDDEEAVVDWACLLEVMKKRLPGSTAGCGRTPRKPTVAADYISKSTALWRLST